MLNSGRCPPEGDDKQNEGIQDPEVKEIPYDKSKKKQVNKRKTKINMGGRIVLRKLHEKSEIWFALTWIIIYVVGASICDRASNSFGFEKLFTLIFAIVLVTLMLMCVKQNNFFTYYGLCKGKRPAKDFLFYIPMFAIFSINLWYGVAINTDIARLLVYIAYMLIVGFIEELLFRGFLFKAMEKSNLKAAIIVSSLTFGLGHIVNFFNGNADLLPTLLQMCYAFAVGFLFVVIMWKGKSMIPCIIAHSVNNALSAFANAEAVTREIEIISAAVLCTLSVLYAVFILWKTSVKKKQ